MDPVVEWIGDIPLMHGERGDDYGAPGTPGAMACLCGEPNYLMCPEFLEGGVYGLTLGAPYGGRLDS